MDISKIVRRSWEITKTHHYMWWLGILALFTQGVGFGINSVNHISDTKLSINSFNSARNAISFDQIQNYSAQHVQLITVIVLSIIIISIILMYISYSARAGMILAANDAEEKLDNRVKNYFRAGIPFAWRLFGLQIIVNVFVFAVAVAFAVPGYFVYMFTPSSSGRFIFFLVYCIIMLITCIASFLYASLFTPLATRSIILHHRRIDQAAHDAYSLIRYHRITIVIVWATTVLIGFVYSLICAGILLGIFLVGGLFALNIYSVGGAGGTLLLITPSIIIIGCFFAVLGGIYQAFLSTYWTLSYRALYYTYTHTHKK